MLFIFVAYIILCLYKVKLIPCKEKTYFSDYMSKDKSLSIKGIFILLVFFSHFNSYVSFTSSFDMVYVRVISLIGQAMVAMFMFYSGYGVMESIRSKGMNYVHSMPKKRIFSTWIHFAFIVALYVLLTVAIGNEITLKQLLLSFIGWDSVGNSNWYIFDILCLYLITYISFLLIGNKCNWRLGAYLSLLLTMGGILCMYFLKQSWWYDTVLCYSVGMLYSLWREKIEKAVNKNQFIWLLCFVLSVAITIILTLYPLNIVGSILRNIMFAVSVVIMTMRIQFHNRILNWCGINLFALYMLQRIPMIILKKIGIMEWNIYVSFVLCLAITVCLAIAYAKVTNIKWNKLFKRNR